MISHLTNRRRGAAKRFTISGVLLCIIACFGLAFCTMFGFLVKEYLHLKTITKKADVLENRLADQHEILQFQHKQIQNFASEINVLKDKLVDLGRFGEKIRVLAGLAPNAEVGSLSGVGGSAPVDLHASLDLMATHNALLQRMRDQVARLNQETDIQQEDYLSLIGALQEQRKLLARTPSIYPVKGNLTSTFGIRRSPFTGKSELHKGIDIAARKGTTVVAPAGGRVTMAEPCGSYGKMMEIDHGYGVVTRYAHLSKFILKKGDRVKRGQEIARIGNTGRSTGPHLHYEVHLNGTPVDPQSYILHTDDRQMVSYKK